MSLPDPSTPATESRRPCEHPHGRLDGYGADPDSNALSGLVRELKARLHALEQEHTRLTRDRQGLEMLAAAQAAELEQARGEAETARQAKRVFLSNLSHEVRTPLNVIQGMAYILGQTLGDPGAQDKLARIREAGARLLQLFDDLIDLARSESGRLGTEAADFDPSALLEEVRATVTPLVQAKGLAFAADWGWLPPRLRGDPQRLRQVLTVYLDNAVKFTDQGAVRLRARVLEESAQGLLLRFEVADTGAGIAADLRPRLFQAFEQGDTSSTRRHGGSGLGLALARSLARLMGGETGVESTPGVGSTFWFTVRLALPDEPVPAADLLRDITRHAGAGDPSRAGAE